MAFPMLKGTAFLTGAGSGECLPQTAPQHPQCANVSQELVAQQPLLSPALEFRT